MMRLARTFSRIAAFFLFALLLSPLAPAFAASITVTAPTPRVPRVCRVRHD